MNDLTLPQSLATDSDGLPLAAALRARRIGIRGARTHNL